MEGQKCTVCKTNSGLKCGNCGDFYCSVECQQLDYPTHRYICFEMPELINEPSRISCCACRGPACFKCARCREFYCSKECQFTDWVRHRLVCFPKPLLVEADRHVQSVGLERTNPVKFWNIPINKTSVLIISFVSTNRLYLKPKSKETEAEISKIIKMINDYAESHKLQHFDVAKNEDFGLVQIKDCWYRFQIINWDLEENFIKIFIIDTGKILSYHLNDLYHLPSQYYTLKHYIIKVELKDVPEYSFADDPVLEQTVQRFEGLYRIQINKVEDRNGCLMNVMLFRDGEAKSLNQKLKERLPLKFVEDALPSLSNKVPDGVFTIISYSNILEGYLACIPAYENKWFLQLQNTLANLKGIGLSYQPKLQEMCIVKMQSNWHRGKCIAIMDHDMYRILLADYGYEKLFNLENIRKYPTDLTKEVKTIIIFLDGLPKCLKNYQITFLKNLFANQPEIMLKDLTYLESNMYLAKSDVIAKMRRACLIFSPRTSK